MAPGDEGDGQVGGGAAGQAPSGGKWTGERRGCKKLENQYVLEHFISKYCFFICFLDFVKPLVKKTKTKIIVFCTFLKHPCDSHTVLKLNNHNFDRGFKFEQKRRRPVRPV